MNLDYLQNKRICILGHGIENRALIEFLIKKKIKSEITICDARKNIAGTRHGTFLQKYKYIKWRLGKNYDKNLKDFDIIFRIAGYPLDKLRRNAPRRVLISSPTKLFFELCPTKNIIGVTGTKGKGTTASLIYAILRHSPLTGDCDAAETGDCDAAEIDVAEKSRVGTAPPFAKGGAVHVYFGGNIGIPMFGFMDKIKKNDWVVLELSSFQLEDMDVSPKVAVITNFSKEHLAPADPNNPNYHFSMRKYWDAKMNIFRWQKKYDYLIINKNFQFSIFNFQSMLNFKIFNFQNLYKKNYKGKIAFFDKSKLESKLIGEHNKENIAAAVEAVKLAGVKRDVIKKAVARFKGLEHRLEFVKEINNIKYYNDSFATTPESAITALKSFSAPIILLAGGADKGSDFKKFAKEIKKRVKFLILFKGKATPKIKREVLESVESSAERFCRNKIKLVDNMKDAIKIARDNSGAGDIILLSPACASFGVFKNYKERGMLFKEEIWPN